MTRIDVPAGVKVASHTFTGLKFSDGTAELGYADLPGGVFIGSGDKTLTLSSIEDGDEFEYGGLSYRVVSADARKAQLIGCADPVASLSVPGTVRCHGYVVSVTSVAAKAFYGCSGLASVDLGRVESIGTKAFANCAGITELVVPGTVVNVGDYAFYGCSGLVNVVLGDGPEALGKDAFGACPCISFLDVGDGISSVGTDAFKGYVFYDASGNAINPTAENLRGHAFTGSSRVLIMVV